jgi:hypothetical protein
VTLVVLAALIAVAWLAPAEPATAAEPTAPTAAGLQPLITTSELVVGRNRFAFALARQGRLLADAEVQVRVYDIRSDVAQLVAVTPAIYHRLETIEQGRRVHIHPDGSRHLHGTASDAQGIYVSQIVLERPGPWGIEIVARHGSDPMEATRLTVSVLDAARSPLPGTPAPRSRNLIADDVADLRLIDTSEPPDPRLHQTRIADAIQQRRPQIIVFATPKYCTSRVCGPVLDVVRTLIPVYGGQVAFVHQEIWADGRMETPAPTVTEWKLESEPWIFLVDAEGMVRARFEGLATRGEIEAALRRMLRLE